MRLSPPLPFRIFALIATILILNHRLDADVIPAPAFGDGVVLQRDKPIPVWGQASPQEEVTVSFLGHTVKTIADADGQWSLHLPATAANSRSQELSISGQNEIVITDVLVGDVWLLSGQSNMEWPVARSHNAAAAIATAHHPLIRHLKVEHGLAAAPRHEVEHTGWQTTSPETVGAFSAVGYYFAREVQAVTGVPIGLLNISWGGSPIEAWTSEEALDGFPDRKIFDDRYDAFLASYPERLRQWALDQAAYETQRAAAAAAGDDALLSFEQSNRQPWKPADPAHGHGRPAAMFNAMIAPFAPYGLRGMLWYQGETNAGRHDEYRALFSALITDWRTKFDQGDLPFYWVQLANYQSEGTWNWHDRQWAFLREAQSQTLALPNTAQAVIIDIGDNHDIHPRNKQDVGARLAAIALSRIHGTPRETSGPVFAGVSRDGARLRVSFDPVGQGLVARDGPVRALEIAGADGVFVPAHGEVVGTVLIVSSPAVPAPVAVRYAFTNGINVNLFGANGLPVAPFRSDRP